MKTFAHNVHPFSRRHVARAHRHPVAQAIRLGHHAGVDSVGSAIAFGLLAITAWILVGALMAALAGSGTDIVGRFVPRWPWW